MGSTFGSFEIGRRAVHAQQKGVQVTGQNIANANTEGYHRQAVLMKALVPPAAPGVETPPGYGVKVNDIIRVRSGFYEDQMMKSLTALNYWERMEQTYSGIEVIFQEPDETGINVALNEFFDAWQELSVNPENYAVRLGLLEQANSLTGLVRDIYGRLTELKFDVRKELDATLTEINSLAAEVAELNGKISYLQAMKQKSNELLDQRDLCLQELSELINIRVNERADGSIEVLAGGHILLHDDHVFKLKIEEETEEGNGILQLSVQNEMGTKLSIQDGDGAIAGMLQSYNEVFPQYQGDLDELVYALIEEVNNLHREGYGLDGTGKRNFFETYNTENEENPAPSDKLGIAAKFAVSADLTIGNIAASSSVVKEEGDDELIAAPGDGSVALKIARLREALTMEKEENKGTATFSDFFRGVIANLGVEGRETQRMSVSLENVRDRIQERQEAVSGVSLDDEMLNMIQYQHAYNAAARFLNVLDEMLGVMFSEIGR